MRGQFVAGRCFVHGRSAFVMCGAESRKFRNAASPQARRRLADSAED
jgi:hypothetical protein